MQSLALLFQLCLSRPLEKDSASRCCHSKNTHTFACCLALCHYKSSSAGDPTLCNMREHAKTKKRFQMSQVTSKNVQDSMKFHMT